MAQAFRCWFRREEIHIDAIGQFANIFLAPHQEFPNIRSLTIILAGKQDPLGTAQCPARSYNATSFQCTYQPLQMRILVISNHERNR